MLVRKNSRSTRGWIALGVFVCASLLAAGSVDAAKREYRYEEDPIRLGNKALEESRLQDAQKHFEEAITNEYQAHKAFYGLGEVRRRESQYQDAEPLYRQALQAVAVETKNQRYPEAHAGLGLALLRLNRAPEAQAEFEKALAEKGGLWAAEFGMALLDIRDGNYDEALKRLKRGSKNKGLAEGEDQYYYGLALAQFRQGGETGVADAEKNALKAFTMNPGDAEYGELVAEIYTARGAVTLAIQAYEQALNAPGMTVTAPARHNLGQLYEREKQYNDALAQYQEAMKADSTYAPVYKSMGKLLYLAKRYDDASTAYLKYVGDQPNDLEGVLGLTESLLKARRETPALQAAEKAWSLDSTNVDVRLAYARASFLNRKKDRAAALYASSDTSKFEPIDWVRLGQMRLEVKDFVAADELLHKAIGLDSTLADAYFSMGLSHINQQEPDSAEIFLEKAVELAPTSSGAWLNLGVARMIQKKMPEALPALRQATTLADNYSPGWVYYGQALIAADSLDAGMAAYRKAAELDPKNAGAKRGLGFGHLRRQDTGAAIEVLNEATTIDPNNADGWYLLGQALMTKGDNTGAAKAFEKALQANPKHGPATDGLNKIRQSIKAGAQ